MDNFSFYAPTYFAFGKDTENRAGELVRRFGGSRVLLHYGGGEVVINGHRCPIIGNICMDACMIDVTDTDAHEGDSVIIFGEELPVSELSDKLKTIPYEILTSISPRVKRVYYRE